MEDVKYLFEKFKQETTIPSIILITERRSDISITDSKLGGSPYLPKDFAYPTSSKGEPLKLLAQLNFTQMPALANFPKSGILQFFVLPDESIGMDNYGLAPDINKGTYKILYHKEILPKDECMSEFPDIDWVIADDGADYAEELFPFKGEFFLKGEISTCYMPYSAYEFDNIFAEFCKRHNVYSNFEPYFIDENTITGMTKTEFREYSKVTDIVWKTLGGDEAHHIGGYPYFIQKDPRGWGEPTLKKYDTLLLAIASEYNTDKERKKISMGMMDEIRVIHDDDVIMWGDAGVANFLINSEDLKNLAFHDVLYTWDSC